MKIRDIPQSGSLGQTVTYESRYGQVRRQQTIPRNPRTAVQMGWRAAFQQARRFWGTLSDEQLLAWEAGGKVWRRVARRIWTLSPLRSVAAGILPAVEPGILPGGRPSGVARGAGLGDRMPRRYEDARNGPCSDAAERRVRQGRQGWECERAGGP